MVGYFSDLPQIKLSMLFISLASQPLTPAGEGLVGDCTVYHQSDCSFSALP